MSPVLVSRQCAQLFQLGNNQTINRVNGESSGQSQVVLPSIFIYLPAGVWLPVRVSARQDHKSELTHTLKNTQQVSVQWAFAAILSKKKKEKEIIFCHASYASRGLLRAFNLNLNAEILNQWQTRETILCGVSPGQITCNHHLCVYNL